MTEDINSLLKIAILFSLSFLLTVLLLPRLSAIASKIGLIDQPNSRKVHKTPKPLVGGIAMVMASSVCSFVFIPSYALTGFFTGIILLAIVGFLDDFRDLNHRWKFLAQILATILLMFISKTYLLSFGDLFNSSPLKLGIFTIPITIFCVIGVINAVNMIDGLDGLAGGIAFTALIAFSVLSYLNGQNEIFLLSLAIAGAVAGFLKYNWHPARLFMGDTGSLTLGFSLAFLSITITQKEDSLIPPMAPLIVLALPIVDTVTVMIRRTMMRKSPFYADKNHIHHILLRMGFSQQTTVIIILSISALFSLLAIASVILQIEEHYLFMLFLLFFFTYFLSSLLYQEHFLTGTGDMEKE